MTADITIGGKPIKLCGNAATAIRYKAIFHRDLLMSFKGMSADDFDADIIKELAFVMAEQAQGADFKQVTFEDFVDWISQFEENDLLETAADIINVWIVNTKSSATAKKKSAPRSVN